WRKGGLQNMESQSFASALNLPITAAFHDSPASSPPFHIQKNGVALLGGQASADSESEARRNQSDSMLLRNKQLCSTCREINTVQLRTVIIPDDLKLSFENFMSCRLKSLRQPKAKTVPKPSHDDISTESIHYRLPILGPRTSVFHGLLSDSYKTLQAMQPSSMPRREPMGKTTRQ
ncbi:uncharacterized protein WCI35_019486, partial [Daubentonia madagascariensis]